jgi:hypothetical protein
VVQGAPSVNVQGAPSVDGIQAEPNGRIGVGNGRMGVRNGNSTESEYGNVFRMKKKKN